MDVRRRLEQHAGARAGGAKALRGDPPARLRYVERAADRAEASRREFELKRMRADEKRALLAAAAAANGGEALNDAELAALDPLRGDGVRVCSHCTGELIEGRSYRTRCRSPGVFSVNI